MELRLAANPFGVCGRIDHLILVLDVMVTLAGDGTPMFCVTHEKGFARPVADRIVFMDEGRIMGAQLASDFFT